jgi:hypothetical protein
MSHNMTDSNRGNRAAGDWSVGHRILFRFTALYWILYFFPQSGAASLVDILPWNTESIARTLAWPLQQLSLWIGTHVFHLTGVAATFHPTGSGDTALSYILILNIAIIALFGAAIWSVSDRRRLQYRSFDAWLRLFLCFTLAITLLGYGFAKVFPGQFGPPSLARLTETYGESSPMGLLWTFMGASRWYAMFGGLAEVVPGLFLFFRRTRTFGALLSAAVMTNIVALNFFYDVPVKIYSSHLLLLSMFLAGPDLAALARLFFLRQEAQLRTDHVPASERRWLRRVGYGLQALVLLSALYTQGYQSYQPYSVADTTRPMYGLWRVEHATATIATTPWTQISISTEHEVGVRLNDGGYIQFNSKIDSQQRIITLTNKDKGDALLHYTLDATNPRHAAVSGTWNKGSIAFEIDRKNPDKFLLQTRSFHWISEYPFNK